MGPIRELALFYRRNRGGEGVKTLMSWTSQEHQAALQAARAGQADQRQLEKLAEAARQAGSRGREAARALQGKK